MVCGAGIPVGHDHRLFQEYCSINGQCYGDCGLLVLRAAPVP